MNLWEEGLYRVLVLKPQGKSPQGDLGVEEYIILGRICGFEWCVYNPVGETRW